MLQQSNNITTMKTYTHIAAGIIVLLLLLAAEVIDTQAQTLEGNKKVVSKISAIEEFSEISVDQNFNLFIFSGTSNKIIIETDENILDNVIAINSGNTLNILCMKKINYAKALNIFVTTTSLKKISLSGQSNVRIYPGVSDNLYIDLTNEESKAFLYFNEKSFTCTFSGYGVAELKGIYDDLIIKTYDNVSLNIDVSTKSLRCFLKGESVQTISGITKELYISTQSFSKADANNMSAEECKVIISDHSSASVNSLKNLEISGIKTNNTEITGSPVFKSETKYPIQKIRNENNTKK